MNIVITDHAAGRWLERVRDVDIEAIRSEIAARGETVSDPGVLAEMGISRQDVADLMLTPSVVAAISAGAVRVKSEGMTLFVVRNQDSAAIATVTRGAWQKASRLRRPARGSKRARYVDRKRTGEWR